MVSDPVLRVFSSSFDLTFVFRFLSIFRISLGNGMPLSFSHSHSRCWVFSLICSNVMVMGLHQSVEVTGDSSDSGGSKVLYCLVGTGLGLVVGAGASCLLVVVVCEWLGDCDITTTSFTFPGMSTICLLSPSSLAFSSSSSLPFSPSFPFPSFPFPSLFSLCFSSSSLSMVPSKPTNPYPVAVGARFACFVSQASRRDLMAANVVQMWLGNRHGFSRHHLSSIPHSFASSSLMLVFAMMSSFMAQFIMVFCSLPHDIST